MRTFTLLLTIVFFNPIAWACDPNKSCGLFDVKCEAEKLLCRTQCPSINKDADMHITSARTAISVAEEKILGYREDIGELYDDTESAKEQYFFYQEEQESFRSTLLDLDKLLTVQVSIQEFVRQTKLENPAALVNVENVEKLIAENSSNLELSQFLTAYALVLAQDNKLASDLLSPNLNDPIFLIKERTETQLMLSAKHQGGAFETMNALGIRKKNKQDMIADEFQKIHDQEDYILEQEDRKCPPIL